MDVREIAAQCLLATSTNNSIGAISEANLPKILAQVLGKFLPDVSGAYGLQIANETGTFDCEIQCYAFSAEKLLVMDV